MKNLIEKANTLGKKITRSEFDELVRLVLELKYKEFQYILESDFPFITEISKSLSPNLIESDDDKVMIGVNINDSEHPYTDLILSGEKTVETRDSNRNALRPLVGKRIGIVRTGKGTAKLVGYATVGEEIIYNTKEEFDADYDRHRVIGGKFGFKNIKYGYPMLDVVKIEPRDVPKAKGVIKTRPIR